MQINVKITVIMLMAKITAIMLMVNFMRKTLKLVKYTKLGKIFISIANSLINSQQDSSFLCHHLVFM